MSAITLPAHANLITNEDFSTPCRGPYLHAKMSDLRTETVTFGDVDVVNTMWREYAGTQA
jgi:hypothetical protein